MSRRPLLLRSEDISEVLQADDDSDIDSDEEFQEIMQETFEESALMELPEWRHSRHSIINRHDGVSIRGYKKEMDHDIEEESPPLVQSGGRGCHNQEYIKAEMDHDIEEESPPLVQSGGRGCHNEEYIKAEMDHDIEEESTPPVQYGCWDRHGEESIKAEMDYGIAEVTPPPMLYGSCGRYDEEPIKTEMDHDIEDESLPPIQCGGCGRHDEEPINAGIKTEIDHDIEEESLPPVQYVGCGREQPECGRSVWSMSATTQESLLAADRVGQRKMDEENGWTYVTREQLLEQPVFENKLGVSAPIDKKTSPYECLSQFLTEDFWKLIKTETNRYASQMKAKLARRCELKNGSILGRWKPVTLIELKQFFSVIIHMTLVQKEGLDSYWSTKSILHSPFASKIMSRDRFKAIYSCLHLNDNTKYIARGNENYDAFFKLRPYFDGLCRLCQTHYVPNEKLKIDEGTCGLRSRVNFRVFNKDKSDKYGKKIYMLCDAETGYVLTMTPYVSDSKPAQEIIMGLLEPYFDKWHTVYMDQFFTSPAVFDLLWDKKTRAVGTVMLNNPSLPQEWRHQLLGLNEMAFCHRGNLTACKWKDKQDVPFLSTKHAASWSEVEVKARGGRVVKRIKPDCVLDYNNSKCGFDLNDQYVSHYSFRRKSMKWWKKMFFHLLARSMVNSYIIYNKSRPAQKKRGFAKFLTDCGEALAQEAGFDGQRQHTTGPHGSGSATRLIGRHFVDKIPPSDVKARTRVCKVCADTIKKATGKRGRKETTYFCPDCNVPLCVKTCFKKYHTMKDYTE